MEHDVEDTVIRPRQDVARHPELDDEDTRIVSRPLLAGGMQTAGIPSAGVRTAGMPSVGVQTAAASATISETPPTPPAPRTVVSPSVYRFRVNTHEPIALERPAHIGRRPALSRVPQRVRPRLVRVPSPLQEVSGTHLEVRQEGASVVVTDLRSTNGTVVTIPGGRPRALRPGEALVVTPGTLIDIGDGNVIEILPLQRTTMDDPLREGATL